MQLVALDWYLLCQTCANQVKERDLPTVVTLSQCQGADLDGIYTQYVRRQPKPGGWDQILRREGGDFATVTWIFKQLGPALMWAA